MSVLEVSDLSVEVAGSPILEGLTLSLRAGDKTGVVGRNGAGKTSLLNVIAGEETPLAGRAGGQGGARSTCSRARPRRSPGGRSSEAGSATCDRSRADARPRRSRPSPTSWGPPAPTRRAGGARRH